MKDYQIDQALEGILALAESNFPAPTDIVISVQGSASASIRIPSLAFRGLLEFAKRGRSSKAA